MELFFSVDDLFDLQDKSDVKSNSDHPSSDIFNFEHQMRIFMKTFFPVDDTRSQWRCANAGCVVNQKICELYCYVNFCDNHNGQGVGPQN